MSKKLPLAPGINYRTHAMNAERAGWAEAALREFERQCMCGAGEDDATIMGDLVADLMHYCAQNNLDWAAILATAGSHFEFEAENEDE